MGIENERYGRRNARVGVAAGFWLITQDPMLIAPDNCCIEVRPSEAPHSLPIHFMMLIRANSAASSGETAMGLYPPS